MIEHLLWNIADIHETALKRANINVPGRQPVLGRDLCGARSAAFVLILFHELFDREVAQRPLGKAVDVLRCDLMGA